MHRTMNGLRLGGLLVGLMFLGGTKLLAQPPVGDKSAKNLVVVIYPNQTKQVGMSKREGEALPPPIAKVTNETPKVAKVQSISDDPRHVLVTGLAPGTSKITFTDTMNNIEVIEVRVTSEEEPIREAQRQELAKRIKQFAPTANIEVFAEPNNLIILRGFVNNATVMNVVQELVKSYFPQANLVNEVVHGNVQQIQLEVVVAVVNRSELRNMTFNFVRNKSNSVLASLFTPISFTNTVATGLAGAAADATATGGNLVFARTGANSSFTAVLEALATEQLATILSIPTVVTQSGKVARFQSGGETPIVTATAAGAPPTVQYRPFGTVVQFLPVILDKGKISLEVSAEISAINPANGINTAGLTAPGFDVRRTESVVTLEDGQTLAIGGLIQTSRQATISKVPVLGDVPFLNTLFTSKADTFREEEMLILVTPRLVDPLACTDLPKYLPGRETRRPDDFELFLEGAIEAPRGQRNICGPGGPDNGFYTAPFQNSPTKSIYPCNDGTMPFEKGQYGILGRRQQCGPNGCTPGTNGALAAPATGGAKLEGPELFVAPAPVPSLPTMPTPPSPLPMMPPATGVPAPSSGLSTSQNFLPTGGYSGTEVTPPLRVFAPQGAFSPSAVQPN